MKLHIKLHLFSPHKTWFLYDKVKQSSYAKLALHKGEFNARLQSTGVSLMANCLSKLKRKEQMIRYKKVLKSFNKRTFHKYNIGSSRIARGVVQAPALRSYEKWGAGR